MIRSKEEVLIDSRTGNKEQIYFDCPLFNWDELQRNTDKTNGKVSFVIMCYKKVIHEGKSVLVELEKGSRIHATYKLSTFLSFAGEIKFKDYQSVKDQLMIEQIGLNHSNYWGLTSDKLEIAL